MAKSHSPKKAEQTTLEWRSVEDVIPYARNPRLIPDSAIGKVAASIKEFGFKQPIVVDQEGVIVVGHTRLAAAQRLGMERVPVLVAADLSPAQVKAYRIADNRTGQEAEWDLSLLSLEFEDLAAFDFDVSLTGFEPSELVFGDEASEIVEDEAPEPPEEPVTKPGDLWLLGEHRVMCGDSTDAGSVALLAAGRRAQMVVTDPPYGVAYESRGRKTAHKAIAGDATDDADLAELLTAALGLAFVNLEEGCACYVFHGDSKRLVFERAMTEAGYLVHQTLVWVKDSFVLGRLDYQPQHEPILYGWRPGGRHAWYGGRKRTAIVADQEPDLDTLERDELVALLRELYGSTDVIRHDRPRRSDEHPTMKPVGLLSRLIVNSTKKGALVYDPFLGSGSTLIAAEQLGRVCYGMEIDPAYCDVIVRRWEEFTGKRAQRGA